jgi:hypothetical protein
MPVSSFVITAVCILVATSDGCGNFDCLHDLRFACGFILSEVRARLLPCPHFFLIS